MIDPREPVDLGLDPDLERTCYRHHVAVFYDRAFRAALRGCMSIPVHPGWDGAERTIEGCFEIARLAAERRFGIKVGGLPGDPA